MIQIAYGELFDCLLELGFRDSSTSLIERVFEHKKRGMVLAFSMMDDPATDRPVRPADVTSVEYRLQQEGLLTGPLSAAIHRQSKR